MCICLYFIFVCFVCVEVLWPSQPNGVMSSGVSSPNHTFYSKRLTSIVHILSSFYIRTVNHKILKSVMILKTFTHIHYKKKISTFLVEKKCLIRTTINLSSLHHNNPRYSDSLPNYNTVFDLITTHAPISCRCNSNECPQPMLL